jgi:hypothetical protein
MKYKAKVFGSDAGSERVYEDAEAAVYDLV